MYAAIEHTVARPVDGREREITGEKYVDEREGSRDGGNDDANARHSEEFGKERRERGDERITALTCE